MATTGGGGCRGLSAEGVAVEGGSCDGPGILANEGMSCSSCCGDG